MNIKQPKQRQEGEDRAAFQIGEKPGEGGQRDMQDELRDEDELEESDEVAETGEQAFAKDGQGAPQP